MQQLELWGGPECTVNRVGDRYQDQFALAGHRDRIEDLDLFAGLGLTAIRYPVHWECVALDRPDERDWRWYDVRLERLRALGVAPIAGLVHHGSGPRYTNLLDDAFPALLADHARATAERYPWVERWTPVNEPLTTARFSALYGHWYPHARDEGAFWRALVNQIDGTRLAMRAIRAVNPAAQLIQTDDLGRSYGTASLREQVLFDNVRRWASWDLLCGMVVPGHPLWQRLARHGLGDRLEMLAADPCPPDVIGINHYLTSDRFLDQRLRRYPAHAHGGNGRQTYADVEAVRVLEPGSPGLEGALREAWSRYGIPVAMTEVHNGCTREEQIRWMADAWHTAGRLRDEGIAVQAVTGWALLGSHGWNTLLTAPGIYEPGVFDNSSGTPRPTALASTMRALARGEPLHPAADGVGWWRRPERLLHPSVPRPAPAADYFIAQDASGRQPLLICGATGRLGQAFARACRHRDLAYVLTSRDELDLNDEAEIASALDRYRPWAVVNAAGHALEDAAGRAPEAVFAVNTRGAVGLAQLCAARGIPTLQVSSDLVFDGSKDGAYVEDDAPTPTGIYGQGKADMEAAVSALPGSHLIVRTGSLFCAHDPDDLAGRAVNAFAMGQPFSASDDITACPAHTPDLVRESLDLLIDGATGIWHLTHGEPLSPAAFARRIAQAVNADPALVVAAPRDMDASPHGPARVALASRRGALLQPLQHAIEDYAADLARRLPAYAQVA